MTDRTEELCSGKDCTKSSVKLLKIKYVGKKGRFCELCADDLINAGLVEESENSFE